MRRLFGLIALLALIYGAVWLVQNGYDMTRIAREMASPEPSPAGGDATTAPEAAAELPASTTTPGPPPMRRLPRKKLPACRKSRPDRGPSSRPRAEPADSAAVEPPMAGAPGEAAPAVGDVPTFDIVRVEPSGETVIAGLAAPNTTVEVLDGPEPLATAEANERGEWALVLDAPLPPGTHDLAIRTTSDDKSVVTLSDQRVAVSVPEGADEEPLVVLSTPEAPSAVMQVPEAPEVASAPQAAGPAAPEVAVTAEPEPSASTSEATPEIAAAEETPEKTQESEVAAATPEVTEPEISAPAAATEAASGPEARQQTTRRSDGATRARGRCAGFAAGDGGQASPPVAEGARGAGAADRRGGGRGRDRRRALRRRHRDDERPGSRLSRRRTDRRGQSDRRRHLAGRDQARDGARPSMVRADQVEPAAAP